MNISLPSAMLMGATGLVGAAALPLLAEKTAKVWLPGRRSPSALPDNAVFVPTDFVDFSTLDAQVVGTPDVLCIAFGTTIKQAGSQERFKEIDLDYPLALARWAVTRGTQRVCLISAVGANALSRVFYNRIKGELEDALSELSFRSVHILRPSLLLGAHSGRPLEQLSQVVMGPLASAFPARVRPIRAEQLARTLVACALNPQDEGRVILEGQPLFEG